MSYAGESAGVTGTKTPRLLDQVRAHLRLKHCSLRTKQKKRETRGGVSFCACKTLGSRLCPLFRSLFLQPETPLGMVQNAACGGLLSMWNTCQVCRPQSVAIFFALM